VNILHREKLLAAISLVRKIDSVDELDAFQGGADDILRETLDYYDDGAIDEPRSARPPPACPMHAPDEPAAALVRPKMAQAGDDFP